MLKNRLHREHEMRLAAHQLGMDFQPTEDWGLTRLLRGFRLFRQGGRRRITHVLSRRDEWHQMHLRIFDYRYTIGNGKSRRILHQTVFFVESKRLGLPEFWMQPEHFFHRIGTFLGLQDIDFEESPDFSDNYLLRGHDEHYIRASMNPDVLHFFSVEKGWRLEACNYFFILYRRNRLFNRQEIKALYDQGMALHDFFAKDETP